ncbi:MAG: glycosyltransferase family 4 protein [Pseudolabrys sp.]
MPSDRPLNILHVFRAPVGGLFRHVLDLSRGQIERGHRVGLIADSQTGGARAEAALAELGPRLALGLTRIKMRRAPGPLDFFAVAHVNRRIRDSEADVTHGHGAKGGAFARLAFWRCPTVRAYTPHGGSLWYEPGTLTGKIYLGTEKLLMRRGGLYLFESEYSSNSFRRKIGTPPGVVRVIHNGVAAAEFAPVELAPDATDLLFLGEFRVLKGIDILIEAMALLGAGGRKVTATLIGDGPDSAAIRAAVTRHVLNERVRFMPPMPVRQALALGHVMVVPSRAESLPYVVLEAAAAGKPLLASRVGGIPEIYGELADALVPPDDATALAKAISASLDDPAAAAALAYRLRERVASGFSLDGMVEGVLEGYRAALSAQHQNR